MHFFERCFEALAACLIHREKRRTPAPVARHPRRFAEIQFARSLSQKPYRKPSAQNKPLPIVIRSERSHRRAVSIVREITETGKVPCDTTKGRATKGNHAAPPQRANYRAEDFRDTECRQSLREGFAV